MKHEVTAEDCRRIANFYGGQERGDMAIEAFRKGGPEAELYINELGDPESFENNGTRRFILNTALRLMEGGGR